jgi:glycosyltransferase involved in cell wall biosynthesis
VKTLIAHNRYRSIMPSGENAVVEDDIRLLRQAGVDVVPFLASSDDIPFLTFAQRLGVAAGPIYNPQGVRRFRAALRQHSPDVVHVHNVFPLLSPWVVRAAHEADAPIIQTVHNFRHDCVAGTYFRDGGLCTDCHGRRFAGPAVQHNCYRGSRPQSLAMALGRSIHKGTWRSVDHFLALTSFHATYLATLGIPRERVSVRPTFAPDPGPGTSPGRDLLFVGRLEASKGLSLLLHAWQQRREDDRRLRVVGTGPLEELVRSSSLSLTNVDFLGRQSRSDVAEHMRNCGALVIPSLWYEGMPRVLVEAFSHGRPVIASAHGGLAAVVDEAVGWTVPPNVGAWAAAFESLSDEQLNRRGDAARRRYLDQYDERHASRSLLAIYKTVGGTRQ